MPQTMGRKVLNLCQYTDSIQSLSEIKQIRSVFCPLPTWKYILAISGTFIGIRLGGEKFPNPSDDLTTRRLPYFSRRCGCRSSDASRRRVPGKFFSMAAHPAPCQVEKAWYASKNYLGGGYVSIVSGLGNGIHA